MAGASSETGLSGAIVIITSGIGFSCEVGTPSMIGVASEIEASSSIGVKGTAASRSGIEVSVISS